MFCALARKKAAALLVFSVGGRRWVSKYVWGGAVGVCSGGRAGRKEGRRCWFMTMMGVMSKRASNLELELVFEKLNLICVWGRECKVVGSMQ